MNRTRTIGVMGRAVLVALPLLAVLLLWVTLGRAAPGRAPAAQNGAPALVSYQGEVRTGTTPYVGTGHFKFSVVNAAGDTTYWSNDGTGTGGDEPSAAVALDVSNGVFSLLLGDTTLGGMSQPLDAAVFDDPARYLRVWFSPTGLTGSFVRLEPDTRVAAVPYALQAQVAAAVPWSGVTGAPAFQEKVGRVLVVAQSGGDYTAVQPAIDAITDASAANPYLVWVAPGVYSETVTLKPHVHLQGAGAGATLITSTQSADNPLYPAEATLVLTHSVSLRDLTVGNAGAGVANVAILATAGTTDTLLVDVVAQARGTGNDNHAIVLHGAGTRLTLQDVNALAEHGSDENHALHVAHQAQATIQSGTFTGRGGTAAYGVRVNNGAMLEAEGCLAVAENGNQNYGLAASSSTRALLRGGSFTARSGSYATGISNYMGRLTATGVIVLAENAVYDNVGLANGGFTAVLGKATLYGGSFAGRGGQNAYGIRNRHNNAEIEARGVTALGEDGSTANYGLSNSTNNGNVWADSSQFIGATDAVRQGGAPVWIGTSLLDGGASLVGGTETLICFQVYDASYTAYTCP
jgi:hypothetical protein